MKIAAPYIQFALKFRAFLDEHGFSVTTFHDDLRLHMREAAPSLSTVYMAFYGQRLLPLDAILFMQKRYKFAIDWREIRPVKNLQGAAMKSPQLALPGIREMKR